MRHLGAKAGPRHPSRARRVQGSRHIRAFFVYTPPSPTACAKNPSHLRSNPLACNQQGPSGLTVLHVPLNLFLFCVRPCVPRRATFLVTPAASGQAINLRPDQQISIFLSMLCRAALTESQKSILTFWDDRTVTQSPCRPIYPNSVQVTPRSVKCRQDGAKGW